jgi:hypothetical protein
MQTSRKAPIKGVQNIRTHAGKVDHQSHPHMAYMRIGCLEMEKERKIKEKAGAQRLIDMINQRLQEIEDEKADIQLILGDKPDTGNSRENDCEPETGGGFKIRY